MDGLTAVLCGLLVGFWAYLSLSVTEYLGRIARHLEEMRGDIRDATRRPK